MGKTWYFWAAVLIAISTGLITPYIARACPDIPLLKFVAVHVFITGIVMAPMLTLKGHHFR